MVSKVVSSDGEREPLLSSPAEHESSLQPSPKLDQTEKKWRPWLIFHTTHRRYRFVPLLGCLTIFINEAEYFVKQIALLRGIESLYCIEYYAEIDPEIAALGKHIPEKLCKADVIQKQIASTAAGMLVVRMTCAMIGAIPLGYIADRYGRKIVLVLHKVNVLIMCLVSTSIYLFYPVFPIWTLYFSGISGLIGGNFDLGLAILFASYADVIPDPVERSSLFFLTTSMQFVGQAIIPPIGGKLMNLDGKGGTVEASLFASLGLALLTVFIAAVLYPETKKSDVQHEHTTDAQSDLEDRSLIASVRKFLTTKLDGVRSAVEGVGTVNMSLLAAAILLAMTGIKQIDWYQIIQYPVVKLGWTFPQAAKIVSVQAILTLVTFFIFIPAFTKFGKCHFGSDHVTFMSMMLVSILCLTIGAVFLGFSATEMAFFGAMVIYTLGEGLTIAAQSYIASLIDENKLARVLAVLSLASTGGKVLASVIFPRAFAIGLDSKVEILKGLPFFESAALFLLAGVALGVVGLRARKKNTRKDQDMEQCQD